MIWAICLVCVAAVVALVMHWWRLHSRLFHIDTRDQSVRQYLRQRRYRIDP